MPDQRSHRGPHPADEILFGAKAIENLQFALADVSLLLTKGYAAKSTLKLVGDRFSLTQRQRLAIMRSACSDQQRAARMAHRIESQTLAGKTLVIDGYNVLITIEAALSQGIIFKGRDGCYRDLASVHGTYRKVHETVPAVQLIGFFLKEKGVREVRWLLDSPVSNSGRLKTLIRELAEINTWNWKVELLLSPDAELKQTGLPVATSDSVVLDACQWWINLAMEIINERLPDARVIDLAETGV
jgi:hypothetical protein